MRLGAALQEILDCAETELVAAGRSVPDDVFISPGLPAFDNLCGQLWIRVIRGYPTTDPPNQTDVVRPCGHPIYMQVGVGITRCQTGLDRMDQQKAPTPAQQTADALGIICDQGALYRALMCCAFDDKPHITNPEWTQAEPQQVIGGEWTAWVEADLYCEETSP